LILIPRHRVKFIADPPFSALLFLLHVRLFSSIPFKTISFRRPPPASRRSCTQLRCFTPAHIPFYASFLRMHPYPSQSPPLLTVCPARAFTNSSPFSSLLVTLFLTRTILYSFLSSSFCFPGRSPCPCPTPIHLKGFLLSFNSFDFRLLLFFYLLRRLRPFIPFPFVYRGWPLAHTGDNSVYLPPRMSTCPTFCCPRTLSLSSLSFLHLFSYHHPSLRPPKIFPAVPRAEPQEILLFFFFPLLPLT